MKYLKTYKIFESNNPTEDFFRDKINWDLIETLKDLSQDCLDEGGKLLYSVEIEKTDHGTHRLLIGTFFTREEDFDPSVEMGPYETELAKKMRDVIPKDNITFVNLFPQFLEKAIKSWESTKCLTYGFCLYEHGYFNQHREKDMDATKETLKRLESMYPNEKIVIVR